VSGLGDFVNKVGDVVEHGVESATEKAGELADAGLDAAAGLARKVGAEGTRSPIWPAVKSGNANSDRRPTRKN
jgi:hypothetical protein